MTIQTNTNEKEITSEEEEEEEVRVQAFVSNQLFVSARARDRPLCRKLCDAFARPKTPVDRVFESIETLNHST